MFEACHYKQQDYIDQILQNVPFSTTAESGDLAELGNKTAPHTVYMITNIGLPSIHVYATMFETLLFMNTLTMHLLLSNVVDCLYKFKKHKNYL